MDIDKLAVMSRLRSTGLWSVAEIYREEVRIRLKAAGADRATAVETAWTKMWDVFKPVCERFEKEKDGETELIDTLQDVDQFLDPNYSETDPGKWLRDGLIWAAEEFRRIVTDSKEGTTVDISRAATPPPTAWAIFVLETFARRPPAKRGDLIARVLPFASRQHDSPIEEDDDDDDAAEYMRQLELRERGEL